MRKILVRRYGVTAALLAVCATVHAASPPEGTPFHAAVQDHLAAIARRDLAALLPTLTEGKELTMIGPDGSKLDTREQYLDFHRAWFAAKDEGKLEPEIVRTIETPGLGHALIRYRYSAKGPSGPVRTTAWLALTFAREHGRWRLVFDQNTLIQR